MHKYFVHIRELKNQQWPFIYLHFIASFPVGDTEHVNAILTAHERILWVSEMTDTILGLSHRTLWKLWFI